MSVKGKRKGKEFPLKTPCKSLIFLAYNADSIIVTLRRILEIEVGIGLGYTNNEKWKRK